MLSAALFFLFTLSAFAQPAPGKLEVACAGHFGADASHAKLVEAFGADNVIHKRIDRPQGSTGFATILFEQDAKRRLVVEWRHAATRSKPIYIGISGRSEWNGPLGVRVGTGIGEIEKLNGKPFRLNGFGWDLGGNAAFDKTDGKLGDLARRLPIRLHLRADRRRPAARRQISFAQRQPRSKVRYAATSRSEARSRRNPADLSGKSLMRFTIALFALLALTTPARAQEDNVVQKKDIPKEIVTLITCGTDPEFVFLERYGGGWIWKWKCPGNHANNIEAHAFSRDKDGSRPVPIRFPTPYKGKNAWLEELSNSEFFPAAREFNHLFVDPENKRVCRTEARWEAPRDPLKPELMFWRETADCDGKRGWRILVNRKR